IGPRPHHDRGSWRMQRVRVAGLAAVIVALHVIGFGALGAGAVGAGLGLTAYVLGLRHAFDADHIAAIDGTTRKLMADGGRPMRAGGEAGPPRGLLVRLYGRATRAVRRPWQMYPLGVLFGLGFDTATEVALLILAAGAVSSGLPVWGVLALPVLFAAGMTLFDTLDGVFMSRAYGWALARPARRLYYNLVLTALSAGVALLVGGVELAGLVWHGAAGLDLNAIGFAVVALFALTWLVALAVWRLGRLEERLGARAAAAS